MTSMVKGTTALQDASLIDEEVLISAYKKALIFASRKLLPFQRSGIGLDAQDLANEAVEKTLNGIRPWNPEKNPDLFTHLAGCISSSLSNAYTSSHFRLYDRSSAVDDVIEETSSHESTIDELFEFDSKIQFLLDYIHSTREDLIPVAEVMLVEGTTNPVEISDALNMDISEVNAKKVAIKRMMLRTSFLLHYITKNYKSLLPVARAVYVDKIVDIDVIAEKIGFSISETKAQLKTLENIASGIRRGVI